MTEKSKHNIVGVHITDRVQNVPAVQAVLTKYGCSIKTRLGLHDVSDDFCSPNGLLIIELTGDDQNRDSFVNELKEVDGVDVQSMVFSH